ncbi:type II toxin-antitoxin system VapC family toxin [Dyadobacter sp. CY323]|uniref:type II toxin-antitoxin system VapC family toxin n=1 Tax=Dyadobacter sp. CY323 TaxID=2907302 RepID=UPI001F31FFE1|nr:type II toxin-antitoxin system VapC family toxin [Dyadobacter sp. CY323]MCE6991008.1 type II toxin-antitoxin system VapC family toxin [Dyadobacter sp. CY323]
MALKKIALDTNVAIEILNNNASTIQVLSEFDLIYLPVVVCGELLYGAKNSSRISYNLPRYEAFISDCEILNTVEPVAIEYSNVKKQLKENGSPIPENDIWIAAICIVYDIPLFTQDGHFEYISGLKRFS